MPEASSVIMRELTVNFPEGFPVLKSFTGRARAIFGRQECDKRYHLKVQFLAVEFLFLLLCVLFYKQGKRGRGRDREGEVISTTDATQTDNRRFYQSYALCCGVTWKHSLRMM